MSLLKQDGPLRSHPTAQACAAGAPRCPDPTGVLSLQQGWDLCSQIGTYVICSIGHPFDARVSFPAAQWADGAKHHLPGTMGGFNARRDTPRFVRLIESGQFNMQALAPKAFPLDQARQAFQEAADRTVIATAVVPNT